MRYGTRRYALLLLAAFFFSRALEFSSSGEVSKNRSIHAFRRALFRETAQSKSGLVLLIGAEHRLSLPPCPRPFYQHQFYPKRFGTLLAQVIRKLSSIIASLVRSPFIRAQSVDLPTTFNIIEERSIISRCYRQDLTSI